MIGEGGKRCVTKEGVYPRDQGLQEVVSKLRADGLVSGGNYWMGEECSKERK